ncbi:hypothetical protein D3C71_1707500 [compost metagenome]
MALAAKRGMDRQARAPPQAGRLLMDAHRAHDLVRHAAAARHRHQQLGLVIEGIAVVAVEQALLQAEHRAAQRMGFAPLPVLAGAAHQELDRGPGGRGVENVVDAEHGGLLQVS